MMTLGEDFEPLQYLDLVWDEVSSVPSIAWTPPPPGCGPLHLRTATSHENDAAGQRLIYPQFLDIGGASGQAAAMPGTVGSSNVPDLRTSLPICSQDAKHTPDVLPAVLPII